MLRCGILIIYLMLALTFVQAQEGITYRQADSATYASYLAGDWQALINSGKQALDEDIDYFYLRLRMAIAYYYKGEHDKAWEDVHKLQSLGYPVHPGFLRALGEASGRQK